MTVLVDAVAAGEPRLNLIAELEGEVINANGLGKPHIFLIDQGLAEQRGPVRLSGPSDEPASPVRKSSASRPCQIPDDGTPRLQPRTPRVEKEAPASPGIMSDKGETSPNTPHGDGAVRCAWCASPFSASRRGGHTKLFCSIEGPGTSTGWSREHRSTCGAALPAVPQGSRRKIMQTRVGGGPSPPFRKDRHVEASARHHRPCYRIGCRACGVVACGDSSLVALRVVLARRECAIAPQSPASLGYASTLYRLLNWGRTFSPAPLGPAKCCGRKHPTRFQSFWRTFWREKAHGEGLHSTF